MSPRVLFWIPVALRLSLIWISAAVLAYVYTPVIGLLFGLVLMTALATVQLHFLSRLNEWLDNPQTDESPEVGVPGPIFMTA